MLISADSTCEARAPDAVSASAVASAPNSVGGELMKNGNEPAAAAFDDDADEGVVAAGAANESGAFGN